MTKLTALQNSLSLQLQDTSLYFGFINHIPANQDFNIAIKMNHRGNLLPCVLCEIREDYIGLCPLT